LIGRLAAVAIAFASLGIRSGVAQGTPQQQHLAA
jgi:hypothetical protein